MSTKSVIVDVVSDVICPWCFLGKRRLDKATSLVPELSVSVRWRPFFLDPSIPAEGMDRHTYLLNKFGEERLKTIHDPLKAAGFADGVPYEFEKITRTPNTLNAHRLIRWAADFGKQAEIVEALFMAYWHDGRDIGDVAVLGSIAKAHGMDAKTVGKDLASDRDKLEIFSEVQQAQSMGINGVPTFILAQRFGVQGAQSADMLAQGMRRAVEQAAQKQG